MYGYVRVLAAYRYLLFGIPSSSLVHVAILVELFSTQYILLGSVNIVYDTANVCYLLTTSSESIFVSS